MAVRDTGPVAGRGLGIGHKTTDLGGDQHHGVQGRGENCRLTTTLILPEQMLKMVDAMLAEIGQGVTSSFNCVDRIKKIWSAASIRASPPQASRQSLFGAAQVHAVYIDGYHMRKYSQWLFPAAMPPATH